MNNLASWAVVVVVACVMVYTIVEIVRRNRQYKRQKEALDRWFAAYRGAQADSEKERRGKWQQWER